MFKVTPSLEMLTNFFPFDFCKMNMEFRDEIGTFVPLESDARPSANFSSAAEF